MSLIRISNANNLTKWDKEPCDHTGIIKEWFNPDRDPDPSVYWAESESDEVEVASSHSLTELSPNLKGVLLLRIEWADLFAIRAREQVSDRVPGTTGVVSIDFRHWELIGAKAYLNELVRRIRERYEAGEQRFRWIGPLVLRRQLTEFYARPDREVIQEAKRRCRHKLDGSPCTLPNPRRDDLLRQLRKAFPKIPELVIRERAFRQFQLSGNHDADRNWMQAEAELLEMYQNGIIDYKPPRPCHHTDSVDIPHT